MLELDQACFPPGIAYSRSELRAFLSRKSAETIVAEREGRILAFVLGWRRSPTDGYVVTLDVAASARRRGLGRQLLAEIEGRFRAAGVKRVQLETAVANTTAIVFYERLGYRKVAQLAGYYGPGLDAWRMEKALAIAPRGDWRGPADADRPATASGGAVAPQAVTRLHRKSWRSRPLGLGP